MPPKKQLIKESIISLSVIWYAGTLRLGISAHSHNDRLWNVDSPIPDMSAMWL